MDSSGDISSAGVGGMAGSDKGMKSTCFQCGCASCFTSRRCVLRCSRFKCAVTSALARLTARETVSSVMRWRGSVVTIIVSDKVSSLAAPQATSFLSCSVRAVARAWTMAADLAESAAWSSEASPRSVASSASFSCRALCRSKDDGLEEEDKSDLTAEFDDDRVGVLASATLKSSKESAVLFSRPALLMLTSSSLLPSEALL
mmetsp:Transcript_75960/g.148818  ORF Transcript_75960/g.148818 Transcript_75960/m.148818 type:complete len:202 (-) Transcript_75960:334-939(-)